MKKNSFQKRASLFEILLLRQMLLGFSQRVPDPLDRLDRWNARFDLSEMIITSLGNSLSGGNLIIYPQVVEITASTDILSS
jgi:hypothetical protein